MVLDDITTSAVVSLGKPEATDIEVAGRVVASEEQDGRLRTLVDEGRERGFVSFDEMNAALPDDFVTSTDLDDLIGELDADGIEMIAGAKPKVDERPLAAAIEQAYAALDRQDGAAAARLAEPVILQATSPELKVTAIRLLAYARLIEGQWVHVMALLERFSSVIGAEDMAKFERTAEELGRTEDKKRIQALRIAEETGVANTVDPLGGSYYVESLTQKMIDGCMDYFEKIDGFGGMVEAVEAGFPQREIQESAYQYQKAVERKEQVIVGVNKYAMDEGVSKYDILQIDEGVRDHQLLRMEHVRSVRDNGAVAISLEKVKQSAKSGENSMPAIIEAVAAYATVEEICVALRDVYGIYEEPAF